MISINEIIIKIIYFILNFIVVVLYYLWNRLKLFFYLYRKRSFSERKRHINYILD